MPVRRPRRSSSEAARRPRLHSSRGRPCPTTRRSPRHAPACHTCRAGQTRTPRSGGPAVTSCPRAPYYGRDITPSSPLVGPPLFKRPPFLLTPPDSALAGFTAPAVAAAYQATALLASWPPRTWVGPLGPVAPSWVAHCHPCAPLVGVPSRHGWCRRPPPRAVTRAAPTLGETLDISHLSPGQERRRPRQIPAGRAAPTAKGGIADPRAFLGCLS
jgi:hypothetical protein